VNELNEEQLEANEERAIREKIRLSIRLGKDLEKLRKTPEFKTVFDDTFVKTGLDILWQNVRHLEEEQLRGRGNDKNVEIVDLIKGQIKTRLDFQGFIDTIEDDKLNAEAELAEMDKE